MSKKGGSSGSRFDDLFGAARTSSIEPESKLQPIEKPLIRKTKSTDPDYIRTTVYLPKQLHKQLKSAAADEEREMSDIMTLAISQYLEERRGKQN
ncbi:ribbon-helix-helix domain-containing protein [Aliterella atlantica]|uniref:CopG family transcriptional regulator n=1 Tax=Aliterella atlantica CENA595 TaxID=1618023 RepID=A0A0D8ZL32_9CYAN|nr:ribbon-helix-helix protein, CopG family [Aliterella atlantica]KJH69543.1 CopG family transcriptional regulator [Aliterella atlantica CENA595]